MTPHAFARRLASASVALLIVAGCGGGAAGTPPTSAPGSAAASHAVAPASAAAAATSGAGAASVAPCDLLTEADVVELTTWKIAGTQPHKVVTVFPDGCEWTLTGGSSAVPATITLGLLLPGGRTLWDESFAPFRDQEGNKPLDGVGDGALLGLADTAMAVQGDALVNVQYLDGLSGSDETLVAILKRVLENLPG